MPDVTAAELSEWIRPVADEADEANVHLGSLHLWNPATGPIDAWVANFAGTDAADIAAMCLVRMLNAEGWAIEFDQNAVIFVQPNNPEGSVIEYDTHPVQAVARFAARSKK